MQFPAVLVDVEFVVAKKVHSQQTIYVSRQR